MGTGKYRVLPGVYSGTVLVCLSCKGITYIPAVDNLIERLSTEMWIHDLWCPDELERAIARL